MSRFTHSSGQNLQIGDASLYFEVTGNPTGTPLVLLHGGLGNLADFNPILDKLPKHCRFIGIDFRGEMKGTPLIFKVFKLILADMQQILKS